MPHIWVSFAGIEVVIILDFVIATERLVARIKALYVRSFLVQVLNISHLLYFILIAV